MGGEVVEMEHDQDTVEKLLDAAYEAVSLLGSGPEHELRRTMDHALRLARVHDGLVEAILAVNPDYEQPRLETEVTLLREDFPDKDAAWYAEWLEARPRGSGGLLLRPLR